MSQTVRKSRRALGIAILLGVSLGGIGCGRSGGTAPGASSARLYQVVVLRSGDSTREDGPTLNDVRDGLRISGLQEGKSYRLTSRSIEGADAGADSAVESALKDGADLIIPFGPTAAKATVERAGNKPVVFAIWGSPMALGLGKSEADHPANLTGVYTPVEESLILGIARASLPKAKRFGILYNPDDPLSVANKDAILRADPRDPELVDAGQVRSAGEVEAAVQGLLDKPVGAIILATGVPGAPEIIAKATAAKVPVFGYTWEHVRQGAALARVPNARWSGFEAGRRAGRVLQGESPANIPFSPRGSGYTTVMNTKVSNELGLAPPGGIVRDAEKYPAP